MKKLNLDKIKKVIYTRWDAYFTVIYKSGLVRNYMYCEYPELMDIAEQMDSFRFDIETKYQCALALTE